MVVNNVMAILFQKLHLIHSRMDKLKQKENSECDIFVVVDLFLFLISLLYFSYFKMVIKQDTVSRWVNAKGIYLFLYSCST